MGRLTKLTDKDEQQAYDYIYEQLTLSLGRIFLDAKEKFSISNEEFAIIMVDILSKETEKGPDSNGRENRGS